MRSRYDELYARALGEPERFWAEAAEAIYWDRRWDRVYDGSRPPFSRWFVGGVLNTCYNALARASALSTWSSSAASPPRSWPPGSTTPARS